MGACSRGAYTVHRRVRPYHLHAPSRTQFDLECVTHRSCNQLTSLRGIPKSPHRRTSTAAPTADLRDRAAIGGGLAAGALWNNLSMLRSGNRLIIAGISLQCLVLVAFGAFCLEFFFRARGRIAADEASPATRLVWASGRFRLFCYALLGAYVGILVRCVYRYSSCPCDYSRRG